MSPHLTFCESLQEWTVRCTCPNGLPCAEVASDIAEDRAEHVERER